MPTVPTLNDRRGGITPLRPARAREADFAIQGQQLQALGQGTERLGNVITDIEVKEQEKENLDAVFRAETELKRREADLHRQVKELRGENAKDAATDAVKFWEKATRDVQENLANEPQLRAFERIAAQRRQASLEFVSGYQATEVRQARIQAAKASSDASIQAGIENPAAAKLNAQAIAQSWRAIGQSEGLPAEYIDNKIQTAQTAMHKGVIGAMVDRTPNAARAYYNDHKDQIKPSERENIEKQLRASDLKGFAQRKADEMLAKHGDDFTAAAKEVRDTIKNADRREAAISQIKARFNEQRAFETERQSQVMDDVTRALITTGEVEGTAIRTVQDLPARLLDPETGLSAADLQRVESYLTAKANAEPNGFSKNDNYQKLTDAETHINRGNIHRPEQLEAYRPFITESTYRNLRTQVEKMNEVSPAVVLKEFELRVGKSKAKWLNDDDTRELWNQFQESVYSRVRGEARPQDIRDLADEFFLETYRPGTGTIFGIGRDRELLGVVQLEGEAGAFVVDIPEDMTQTVDTAYQAARRLGVQVPTGEAGRREFYTHTYRPALQYLKRNQIAQTPEAVVAVQILTQAGRVVTPEAIAALLQTRELFGGR